MIVESTATELGRVIERHRRAATLTQEELAAMIDIDRQYLSELERGKVTRHLARLVATLDALGLVLTAVPRTITIAAEPLADDSADA